MELFVGERNQRITSGTNNRENELTSATDSVLNIFQVIEANV